MLFNSSTIIQYNMPLHSTRTSTSSLLYQRQDWHKPTTIMFNSQCRDKAVASDIRAKTMRNESEPKPVVAALSHLLGVEKAFENDQRGDEKQNRMVKQRLKVLTSFLEK